MPEQTRRRPQEYQEHDDELQGKPVGGWKDTWQEKLIHTPSSAHGAKHTKINTSRDTGQRPKASSQLQDWVRTHGPSGTRDGFREQRQAKKPKSQRWTEHGAQGLEKTKDAAELVKIDRDWRSLRLQSDPIQPQFYPPQGLEVCKKSELIRNIKVVGLRSLTSSNLSRMTPTDQTMADKGFGIAPTNQAMAAKGLSIAPRDQAMAAKSLGMAPRDQAMAAKSLGMAPRDQAMTAKDLGMTPRDQAMAAKDLGMTPRDQAMMPTGWDLAPKYPKYLTGKESMALKNSQAVAANLKVDKMSSVFQGKTFRNLEMDRVSASSKKFSGDQGSAEEPFYLRLQEKIQWWEKHAPAATKNLIRHGGQASYPLPQFLSYRKQRKTVQ